MYILSLPKWPKESDRESIYSIKSLSFPLSALVPLTALTIQISLALMLQRNISSWEICCIHYVHVVQILAGVIIIPLHCLWLTSFLVILTKNPQLKLILTLHCHFIKYLCGLVQEQPMTKMYSLRKFKFKYSWELKLLHYQIDFLYYFLVLDN